MDREEISRLLGLTKKGDALKDVRKKVPEIKHRAQMPDDDDGEEYAPVGVDGLLAASEKLLAVNRGLDDVDDRDGQIFKRYLTTDKLLAERIKGDVDKTRRRLMYAAAKHRNLKAVHPFVLDSYAEGMMMGNPLTAPLEEINPLHLMEQSRRITQMGQGGIGSEQAITEDMQCHDGETEVFCRSGWKFWDTVTSEDELACRVGGKLEFHKPSELHSYFYEGTMYGRNAGANFLVTPGHRFWSASSTRTSQKNWKWETAEDQLGKHRVHFAGSEPYAGTDFRDLFYLDKAEAAVVGMKPKSVGGIDMGDWCEFLGWFLSEGWPSRPEKALARGYGVVVTQSKSANLEKVEHIRNLFERLPWLFSFRGDKNFIIHSKQLHSYVVPFGGSHDKFVPDFLFEVKPDYRRRFLKAFLAGDGWVQKSGSGVYSSSSEKLISGLERLIIGMGSACTRGTPWVAYRRNGDYACLMHRVNELMKSTVEVKPATQTKVDYSGMVYCATVPGSFLLTRRGFGSKPIWSGNSVRNDQFGFISPIEGPESGRIGIDVRATWGTKIGDDGRLYQLFKDRSTGNLRYMSPEDLDGKVVKLPD